MIPEDCLVAITIGGEMLEGHDFPLDQRKDGWSETELLAEVTSQLRFRDGHQIARFRACSLGDARLSVLRYSSMLVRRTPRLVRQSDPDLYGICLVKSGRHSMEHAGRSASVGRGQMLLYDSALPFDADVDAGLSNAESMIVQFPKKLIPLRQRHVGQVVGETLGAQNGIERLLFRFLADLVKEIGDCTPQDRIRLQSTVIDLTSAVLAHRLEEQPQLPSSAQQHVLFLRAVSFIREHLDREDLTPGSVAAAHQVSLRTLHRLFEQRGQGIACFIKQQRLERIRNDLTARHLSHLPVHAIGARWGYPRATGFSRSFREAYGEPPGEYRRRVLAREMPSTHR